MKLLQGFKVLTLEKSGKVELETHTVQTCALHVEMQTTEYLAFKFFMGFDQISHCILHDYLKSFHLEYFICSQMNKMTF